MEDKSFYIMPVHGCNYPSGLVGPYATYEVMRREAVKEWSRMKHEQDVIFWFSITVHESTKHVIPQVHIFTDEDLTLKIKMVCETCGSDNVRRDAFAEWDVGAQEWMLSTVFDHTVCERCEGECNLKEVAIESN